MPRRILARRFEPRYGVNQLMLDAEAKWVAREFEDYQLFSINDLREKLHERQTGFALAEEHLSDAINRLPVRERLAIKCMLARDIFHIAKLFETFLQASPGVQEATGASSPMPEEVRDDEPLPVLKFAASLFDP